MRGGEFSLVVCFKQTSMHLIDGWKDEMRNYKKSLALGRALVRRNSNYFKRKTKKQFASKSFVYVKAGAGLGINQILISETWTKKLAQVVFRLGLSAS